MSDIERQDDYPPWVRIGAEHYRRSGVAPGPSPRGTVIEVVPAGQVQEEAVDPAEIVAWLRGRTGAHGGGFTSADDVADAIEREFTTGGQPARGR
jgi:hypothetical protein